MKKTLTFENTKTLDRLLCLEEKRHLNGDPNQTTREEAARTGLGQLALAMEPEFEDVKEDSTVRVGDATSTLDQNVALAMNKGGLGQPLNGPEPGEGNPVQAGPNVAVPAHYQPGTPSYQDGMVRPEDRRGTSASQTGTYMGTAPDGPDITQFSDPNLRRIFSESFAHYSDALMFLAKNTANDIIEAERVLAMDFPLDVAYRKVMEDRVRESGTVDWSRIKESLDTTSTRQTKKEFLEAKKGKKCVCKNGKCVCEAVPTIGSLMSEWFSSPKK